MDGAEGGAESVSGFRFQEWLLVVNCIAKRILCHCITAWYLSVFIFKFLEIAVQFVRWALHNKLCDLNFIVPNALNM